MQADTERVSCDCTSLLSSEECKRRTIQYYIDIPEGCYPIGMSLVDKTNAAALWDKIVRSEEKFQSLSAEDQREAQGNGDIIGIESNRVYEYRGREGASNTRITIARREGDPSKWLFEVSSCCHTIPTLQIDLKCMTTDAPRDLELGLTLTEDGQFAVAGKVLVGFKELTSENYNSLFEDCSVPYCDVNQRRDPDALGSNGGLLLKILADDSCKLDMHAFAEDLGYQGPPVSWDPLRRARLMAELDGYYARLYGLTRDELRYILDPTDVYGESYPSESFRVLKEREIKEYGEYRTHRLVLEAWDRLEAGELNSAA